MCSILAAPGADCFDNANKTVPAIGQIAPNSRVYLRAHELAGGFDRVHPARVLAVDPDNYPNAPLLAEVLSLEMRFACCSRIVGKGR